jgi:effector-binding domain-containing protein
MIDTPQITKTDSREIAVLHLTIPRSEICNVMQAGLRELLGTLAAQSIAPIGPWFTHHLKMEPGIFDFEIGVPVAAIVAAAGRVRPAQRPVLMVARTIYRGPYEGLGAAWSEFDAWIAAQGRKPAADLWEGYLAGPESSSDPANWRTQLERPLVPVE